MVGGAGTLNLFFVFFIEDSWVEPYISIWSLRITLLAKSHNLCQNWMQAFTNFVAFWLKSSLESYFQEQNAGVLLYRKGWGCRWLVFPDVIGYVR